MSANAVEARGVSRSFGPVQTPADVSLGLRPGVVRSIIGENGAGWSTLTSIARGWLQPSSGELPVDGRPVRLASPRDARAVGSAPQEIDLIPALTVWPTASSSCTRVAPRASAPPPPRRGNRSAGPP